MDLIVSSVQFVLDVFVPLCVIFTTITIFNMIKLMQFRKQLGNEIKQLNKIAENIKFVKIEIVNNSLMMYDTLTERFICQATTEEELWNYAKELYPTFELMLTKPTED